ncbi:MAG TPA: ADOP family duplicated permease [Candidatus Acidoferrum sp.]|nr:ADOP family duplicated permease [Candidatus Acidoferrum sp.]
MKVKDLRLRMRALFLPARTDRELTEELESHIALQTRKYEENGMTRADAGRQARLEFGGVARTEEECREARGIDLIADSIRDVRYALRSYRRTPLFAATVVATIALGLGLNTALFTIFDAYYLQSVNVKDPQGLYEAGWIDQTGAGHDFTWDEYHRFVAQNAAFSEAFAYKHTFARMNGRGVTATLVTGNYFNVLGVSAALGRTLVPDDSLVPGSEPVIVVSYSEWQNQFASDPDIVGKKIYVKGFPFQVVGVARAGFTGLGARAAAFWVPITMASRLNPGPDLFGSSQPHSVSIVGRLTDGASFSQAQAGLNVWISRLESPRQSASVRGLLTSRANYKPLRAVNALEFLPILVAFSLVLLIGCANVANMMVARAISRKREIGIRIALGASRARLIRQLLTESVLLALPAAGGGFALSYLLVRLSLRVLNATLPAGINDFAARFPALTPNIEVFGFAVAFAVLAALVFGLIPAMQATRTDIVRSAGSKHGLQTTQYRNALVVGQITISVVVLITAAILLRGINGIRELNAKLSSNETVEVTVQEGFRARVLDRLSADPDVETIVSAERSPVDRKFTVSVMPAEGGGLLQTASDMVSPGYFPAFEIPILRGRNFTEGEATARLPLAIVSETAAERLWPKQDAIGKSLRIAMDQSSGARLASFQTVLVIGVAGDEISRWITNGEDKSLVYLPANLRTATTALFVRSRSGGEIARHRIDSELSSIDPLAADDVRRLQIRDWVAEEAYSFSLAYWVSTGIGLLALLLTLSGIYGVMAFSVSQRTHEIGVRMALGAMPRSVSGLFLKQSAKLGFYGIALGCVLALGMSRVLSSVLVVSNTFSGYAYLGVGTLVLGAGLAAAYIPSRRAAQVEPSVTLRCD